MQISASSVQGTWSPSLESLAQLTPGLEQVALPQLKDDSAAMMVVLAGTVRSAACPTCGASATDWSVNQKTRGASSLRRSSSWSSAAALPATAVFACPCQEPLSFCFSAGGEWCYQDNILGNTPIFGHDAVAVSSTFIPELPNSCLSAE